MSRVYGYVLLPIAFDIHGDDHPLNRENEVEKAIERLWEAGDFDLTGDATHDHEDGGFPPMFVEAGSDYEAQEHIAMEVAMRAIRNGGEG